MLSSLQEQVASIVAGLDEAAGFALAGGGALILRGYIERETRDLDFFGLSPDDVDRLAPAVVKAIQDAGLAVETVQSNHGFVRLAIGRGSDRTELDLAADACFPHSRAISLQPLQTKSLRSTRCSLCLEELSPGISSTWPLSKINTDCGGYLRSQQRRIGVSLRACSPRCWDASTVYVVMSSRSMMLATRGWSTRCGCGVSRLSS
jgi:hypothetical protein